MRFSPIFFMCSQKSDRHIECEILIFHNVLRMSIILICAYVQLTFAIFKFKFQLKL
jgi:hypothetical protein